MDIQTLVQKPEAQRDEAWERDFLAGILQTKVEMVNDLPDEGPDGWPYMFLKTGGETAKATQTFLQVLQWAYTKGVGIALNPHKMMPDYVFTYGMLWNFAETGKFIADSSAAAAGEVELAPDAGLVIGAPTEKYLPLYVRKVLRQFLGAQGHPKPRIAVVSSADYKTVDLAFSLESLGNPAPERQKVIAQNLSWFLPQHYSLIFTQEAALRGWVDL